MSTVAVVKKGDQIAIAADTAQSADSNLLTAQWVSNHSKLINCGKAYLGLAGYAVSQDIIENVVRSYGKKLLFHDRHAIFDTAHFIHEIMKKDYFLNPTEDKEQPVESSQVDMLIASPTGIFEVESYRTVIEYERYWALGSGKRFAIGAMHALYDQLDDASEIARRGVAAACAFDDSCAEPIEVQSIQAAC
ncbi:MAG: MFS transporter [Gammaproteobacteria bacterium]|nr:MFS transporter [Gammaproteobacteria bacterium]